MRLMPGDELQLRLVVNGKEEWKGMGHVTKMPSSESPSPLFLSPISLPFLSLSLILPLPFYILGTVHVHVFPCVVMVQVTMTRR